MNHYNIRLTDGERRELKRLVESGHKLARKITRARILLLADTGKTDSEIAEALKICAMTVYNIRKRFSNEKSLNSLEEKPRSGKPAKLDGIVAAKITALACSKPPEGWNRWTLRLLADKAVKLALVDSVSHEGIRKLLKKRIEAAPEAELVH
jgi:transposase